jgi:hypothetical protein
MTHEALQLPEACRSALAAIETDPLDPGLDAEAHMRSCTACSEARVAYLAQEEAPLALAPAGYFERLPGRIQGKLPARSRPIHTQRFFWGTAAALLLAVGATAFWVGRANRTPLVEAHLTKPAAEVAEELTDTPFQDADDALSQLTALSPEDAEAVIKSLSRRPSPSPSGK